MGKKKKKIGKIIFKINNKLPISYGEFIEYWRFLSRNLQEEEENLKRFKIEVSGRDFYFKRNFPLIEGWERRLKFREKRAQEFLKKAWALVKK